MVKKPDMSEFIFFSALNIKRLSVLLVIFLTGILHAAPLSAASVRLSWLPPPANIDDTPLTDLAGYKLYYGPVSGNYTYYIDTGDAASYQLDGLLEGRTYYFAVTAYDMSGNESKFSAEKAYFISPSADEGGSPYPETGESCPDYIGPYADLYQCDLTGANLFKADLSFANLNRAVLTNASLYGATLVSADLSHADLSGAALVYANLSNANLTGADLSGALVYYVIWWNTSCPDGTNSSDHDNTCIHNLF